MYIQLALDTLGNNHRCVEKWVQRQNRAVNCAWHSSEMVSLSWGQLIGSNFWDWVWQSWGRIRGNSNEEDNIRRVLWSWSDILFQQYSKMSLLMSQMTWTPTNQFEAAGWAIGTILKKICFLSRRGWHPRIIKLAKVQKRNQCPRLFWVTAGIHVLPLYLPISQWRPKA